MDIKQLKPSRRSRYNQGYINPASCKKLVDTKPVIYRSSYERKFVTWLESSPQVIRWGSECIGIPYIYPDGTKHTYYPDYFMETSDGAKYIIEIKPSNQTQAPTNENAWSRREWTKNNLKWKAAIDYCESRGIKFQILTEKTISKLK